jgi:leader peptidase (prepilin peptidase)/N-methyltransferase
VELAIGLLWAGSWAIWAKPLMSADFSLLRDELFYLLDGSAVFCWLLVALAVLDAEHFWLPDWITLPGILLGLFFGVIAMSSGYGRTWRVIWDSLLWPRILGILGGAGLILAIRLIYWIIRRKEGIGLGDAKLMAMLGAWLGLRGAMESFAIAILGATLFAAIWITIGSFRSGKRQWSTVPLPLGTFLCVGALTEVFRYGWFWGWWSKSFGLRF